MPYYEKEITKVYFEIGDIAKEAKVATSAIRFWEEELKLKIGRGEKNYRKYTKEEKDLFIQIIKYIKKKQYTMKGLRELIIPKLKNERV